MSWEDVFFGRTARSTSAPESIHSAALPNFDLNICVDSDLHREKPDFEFVYGFVEDLPTMLCSRGFPWLVFSINHKQHLKPMWKCGIGLCLPGCLLLLLPPSHRFSTAFSVFQCNEKKISTRKRTIQMEIGSGLLLTEFISGDKL